MYAKGEFTMAVYFADAVERFVEDMLEANADNLKAFETKPGVYSNVDPETYGEEWSVDRSFFVGVLWCVRIGKML